MKSIYTANKLAAALALAFVAAMPATVGAHDGEHHAPGVKLLLERFDANGDGKLDDAEKAQARAAKKRVDRNHDGEIGQHERELAKGIHQRFDKDGDGKLSETEQAEVKVAKSRMDADGDGKLSHDERHKAKQIAKAKRDGAPTATQ